MISILILFSSLLFAAKDPIETVRFKIQPRAYNPGEPIQKEYNLDWYGEEFGQPNDSLILFIKLRSDKFDDVWLWQTYNVFQADQIIWVAPKLPAKCEAFDVRYVFNSTEFNIQVSFYGKTCKLKKLLEKEKIFITYKGITVNEENRRIEQVDFIIDDLPELIREFH